MTGEELLENMELIDDDILKEAEHYNEKGRKKQIAAVILAAAAVLLMAGVGVGVIHRNRPAEETWETRIRETEETVAEIAEEIALEKRWEEKSLPERFREFGWQGSIYSVREAVEAGRAAEKLGDVTIEGEDDYTGAMYETAAELYRFDGFDKSAALLVRYAESEEYYCAVNLIWHPATLGDFLAGINARETLLVPGSVSILVYDSNNAPHCITYEGMTKEWLLSWLEKYTDAECPPFDSVMGQEENLISYMDCGIGSAEFGRPHVSLNFTRGGYVWTNLFDAGLTFHVGEDAVQEFEDYVRGNLKGYEYVDAPQETTAGTPGEVQTSPAVTGAETAVEE